MTSKHPALFSLASRILFVLMAVCASSVPASAEWVVTFEDNFDGPQYDRTKWKPSDIWSNQTLGGNKEEQCYVPEALSQADGILSITATKRAFPVGTCKGGVSLNYASGMITTSGCMSWDRSPGCGTARPFSQAGGFFEMRAKLPPGRGLWPAFWLVPIDTSWPPEIDIIEALGQEPNKLYLTYHYKDGGGQHQAQYGTFSGQDFTKSFNTFAVSWLPGKIIWFVNGREVHRVTGPQVSNKPMYILVNLSVGGIWPGSPDASTPLPATMQVDYVRVYQRTGGDADGDMPKQ